MKKLLPLLALSGGCSIEDFCGKDLTSMTSENFGANAVIDRSDGTFDAYSKPEPSSEMKIYAEDAEYRNAMASIIEQYQAILDTIDAETPKIALQDSYPDNYVCGDTSFHEEKAYYVCKSDDMNFAYENNGFTQSKLETCDFYSRAGFIALYSQYLTDSTLLYETLAHEFGHVMELEHTTEVSNANLMDNGGLIDPELSIEMVNQKIGELAHALTCVYTNACFDELSTPPAGWN